MKYTYDLVGHVFRSTSGTALTFSGTSQPIVLTYSYDGAGHLQQIASNWSDTAHPGILFQATSTTGAPAYTPFGGLVSAQLPLLSGSIALSRTYDNRGRPTSGVYSTSSNPALYSYSFSSLPSGIQGYDHVGNITGYNDSVMGVWGYTYDHLNRLSTGTAATPNVKYQGKPIQGDVLSWAYDSFGNRLSQTENAGEPFPTPWAYFHGSNNRMTEHRPFTRISCVSLYFSGTCWILGYFPMQKVENIWLRMSSVVVWPVNASRLARAAYRSSMIIS